MKAVGIRDYQAMNEYLSIKVPTNVLPKPDN